MKPEGPFVADRALAQHSAALLGRAAPVRRAGADVLAAALGARLAAALGKPLAPFLAGAIPEISCGEARIGPCDGPGERPAASFGFASGTDKPLICAQIEADALAGLVERCFGGPSHEPRHEPRHDPRKPPGRLPPAPMTPAPMTPAPMTPATVLLARRIAARLAEVLSAALGCAPLEPQGPGAAIAIPGRTAQFELTIAEGDREPWQICLALSCDIIEAIADPAAARAATGPRGGDPAALPWSAIALPLRAVLVDMAIPLGTVASLSPGMVIPVSVARRVPLKVGGRVVGHGDVGVFDDCAALRLTTLA